MAFAGLASSSAGAAANNAPTPANDTMRAVPVGVVNVLANDTDPDGDPLTVTGNGLATHGVVNCTVQGICSYTPENGYAGTDSFQYTVQDPGGLSGTAVVNITVTQLDTSSKVPVAVDDNIATTFNTPVTANVLANDAGSGNLAIALYAQPTHGTVKCVQASGACTYTPTNGFSGDDGFTYTLKDANGAIASAAAHVTVAAAGTAFGLTVTGGPTPISQGDRAHWKVAAPPLAPGVSQDVASAVGRPTITATLSGPHAVDPTSIKTAAGWSSQVDNGKVTFTAGDNALVGDSLSAPVPAPQPPVSQGTGGDGHVPILVGGKVFAFFHHSHPTSVTCIDRATGGLCPGYPKQLDVGTSNLVGPGAVVGSRIYVHAILSQSAFAQWAEFGLYCWDASTNETCGITVFDRVKVTADPGGSAPVLVGNHIYVAGPTDKLYCFDPSTQQPCATPPIPLQLGADTSGEYDIVTHGSLVYVSNHSTFGVSCLDVGLNGPCSGWTNPVVFHGWNLLNRHDASGTATGVCDVVNSSLKQLECVNDGNPASVTTYSGFPYVSDGYWDVTLEGETGTRTLYGSLETNGLACWDWTTNAACTGGGYIGGILSTDSAGNALPSAYGAAFDGTCLVALGDPGKVFTVDPSGTSPCTSLTGTGAQVIDLRAQRCDATLGTARWTQLKVVDTDLTQGKELSSLVVTLKDASTDQVVAKQDMVGTNGVLDLSTIDPAAHPSLVLGASAVSATGSKPWADGIPPRVVVMWSADPLAGCFDTTTTADCGQGASAQLNVDATTNDGASPVNAHVQLSAPPCAIVLNAETGITSAEGQAFSGRVATVSLHDTSVPASAFHALISWGDGSSSVGTVTGGNGSFVVNATHTYGEEGSFTTTVTLLDGDVSTTSSGSATVSDLPLSADCATPAISPTLFAGSVATFTDADAAGTVGDYTATIDWGDGSTSSGIVTGPDGGPFRVSGSHAYAPTPSLLPYGVHVSVKDAGGSTVATDSRGCNLLAGNGTFVIGDQVANAGTSVTFWGTAWDKNNPRSGCATAYAPDFKGFAGAGSDPGSDAQSSITLGQWRTVSGNDPSPPPGPLPSVIPVVITDCVQRQGAAIAGHVVGTALVRVGPGYSPDPSTPGTGSVVSTAGAAPIFTLATPIDHATVGSTYGYLFAASGSPAPVFSVASGALPDGLQLDASTGALTGTPTKAGSFTFTIRAANGVAPDAVTQPSTITVSAAASGAPVFTAETPLSITLANAPYTYTFAASGAPAPTFHVGFGALPTGLTIDAASGVLSGKPTVQGTFHFAIAATNGVSPDAFTPLLTIVVGPPPVPPAFTADTPPANGIVGNAYSYTFAATGKPAPTFALASGALPDGLTLDATTGVLSGAPTSAGTFTFTVKATNGAPPDAVTPSRTIVVAATKTPPTFTDDTPPLAGVVGLAWTYQFKASGNPAPTFSVWSGKLPDGLTLNTTTGVVSGTPTTAGTFTFTIRAVNGILHDAITPTLTTTVYAALQAPRFEDASPTTPATVGFAYSYQLHAEGAPEPTTYALSSGALPDGLHLDTTTGLLSGTPTTAGNFRFSVSASNGTLPNADTGTRVILVLNPAAPAFVNDTPAASRTVGLRYSYTFSASGAPAPTYTVDSGALPDGMTLDHNTGIFSGTPTLEGTFSFTVRATNPVGPDAVTPTITMVITPNPPTWDNDAPPSSVIVNNTYRYTFFATGFPAPTYSVASGALPNGLTLDPITGVLTGTATTLGTYTFTVDASNGSLPDAITPTLTIIVAPAQLVPPRLTSSTPTPSTLTVGDSFSFTFTAVGTPTPTFAVASGAVPDGLVLDANSGVLSGTVTTAGTFTFTIAATNGVPPDSVSVKYTITVNLPPTAPKWVTFAPPVATVGQPFSYTFVASGMPAPRYQGSSGNFPDGLFLNQTTGVLSGTPTVGGTFTFTILASNGLAPNATSPSITMIVVGKPGPPTVLNHTYSVAGGTELDVAAPGVLDGASAYDPRLPLHAQIRDDNAAGTVMLQRDGSFAYVPPTGFTGSDTFTYIASDDQGNVSALGHVTVTVNAGGPPTATVGSIAPADGTAVRGPVAITATLTPPSGQTISSWKVSYHVPGDPNRVQLASGSGPNVSANFDPTLVRDGTYAINIHSQASGGGVAETESGLIVEGDYKPGRYATTFDDMTVNAANIPIDIQRTYDSTNKSSGDFGIGWSADIVNFRVDTNGPLGRGGWSKAQCGLLGSQICYSSTRKHIVTVTWPDGHVEKFDLTPAKGSNIGSNLTTSAYTAEPGTTSTLTADDIGLSLVGSDFYEGNFFTLIGIYDPEVYTLTTRDGTQYTLDRRLGLLGVKDRSGNTLTIDSTGILSSSGPSVTFTRDGQGRITQISGPTGNIDYTYSPAGDLTGVHYPSGVVQAFTYDANHDLLTTSGGARWCAPCTTTRPDG